MQTEESVRAGIMAHLSKNTGLDLKSLDIDVTNVKFDDGKATATVSFRPKGVSSVHDGMMMLYSLALQNGQWVVVGRADSQGHGFGGSSVEQSLPPGHPPTGSQLPPGHPPVDDAKPLDNTSNAAPPGTAK